MLQTLGDVITCALAIAAVVLVPAATIRAWWPEVSAQIGRLIMSRPGETHARAADTEAVHVPVLSTETTASAAAGALDISDDFEMPRVGRRLSDGEIVTMLAAQKRADGKYRFSANEIYGLVKGPRAEVLTQIREIRDGPGEPVYPPTPHPLDRFKAVN
jgi:hypothetical protein